MRDTRAQADAAQQQMVDAQRTASGAQTEWRSSPAPDVVRVDLAGQQPVSPSASARVFNTPPDIPQPVAMAVTIEPAGGVPAPTGDEYLVERCKGSVSVGLVRMLVINGARYAMREMIVLGGSARLPIMPGPLGVNRIHPAQFFDAFAQSVFFSHICLFYGKR